MANTPIQNVHATSAVSDAKSVPGEPGALEGFDDGTYRFTGNGTASLEDFSGGLLRAEVPRLPESSELPKAFKADPQALTRVLAKLCKQDAPALMNTSTNAPLGNNQVVDVDWLKIKPQLTQLAKSLDTLRAFASAPEAFAGQNPAANLLGRGGGPRGSGLPLI